jgi:hypothetical protein
MPAAATTMAVDRVEIVAGIDRLDIVATFCLQPLEETGARQLSARCRACGRYCRGTLARRGVLLPVIHAQLSVREAAVLFNRMGTVAHGD